MPLEGELALQMGDFPPSSLLEGNIQHFEFVSSTILHIQFITFDIYIYIY